MPANPPTIQALIRQLDHPDAHRQDAVLQRLDRRRDEVIDHLDEALSMEASWSNRRIRRGLLRWLKTHANASSTLALMRYVFDSRGDGREDLGRGIALRLLFRRAKKRPDPSERGRLRGFAEDLIASDNAEIRHYCAKILGYVGTTSSRPALRARLHDESPEVQKAAEKSLEALADARPSSSSPDSLPSKVLLQRLEQFRGPRLQQVIKRWRKHPHRQDVAIELLSLDHLREQALRLLIAHPTPEAREALGDLLKDSKVSALALRAYGKLGDISPTTAEIQALRQALNGGDELIKSAAASAAGEHQIGVLIRPLIAMSREVFLPTAQAAATALAAMKGSQLEDHLLSLEHSLERNLTLFRRSSHPEERLQLVLTLLSSIGRAITPTTVGVDRVQRRIAVELAEPKVGDALRDGLLDVLNQSLDEQTFPAGWSPFLTQRCLHWLQDGSDKPSLIDRLAPLLVHITESDHPARLDMARIIAEQDPDEAAVYLEAWLRDAPAPSTDQLLEEWLRQFEGGALADRSRDLLQMRRLDRQDIDVTYIPRD